jgi:iron complex outermembrane receptor protein
MGGSFGAHALWAHAAVGDDAPTSRDGPDSRARGASGSVAVRIDGARNDYEFVNDSGTRFEPSNYHRVNLTNADTRTVDAWAVGSLRVGERARVDIVANDVERDQGLPGLPLFPSQVRLTLGRRLAGVTSRVACEQERCEITATAAAISTHARYDDPLRQFALGAAELDFDADRIEDGVLIRWRASRRLTLAPALRASIERLSIDVAGGASAHAERAFSRAALEGEWAWSDSLVVRALGSAECHGTSQSGLPPWSLPGDPAGPTGSSRVCSQFEPAARVGIQVGQAPLEWVATIGRYARVPTLTELYGLSGAVRGNTALEPEEGVSLETGVRATASRKSLLRGASVDVFGFVRSASRLVAFQRSSSGYVRPFNVGSARVAGAEILADYKPAAFALFELSATLLDPRNTSSVRPANDVLPYEPRLSLAPRLELHAAVPAVAADAVRLSVSYFYEASRYADAAGLVIIPEQGSLDVEAELDAWDAARCAIRLRLANLLDQTRFDLIGYPLPGRAAYASLEAKW